MEKCCMAAEDRIILFPAARNNNWFSFQYQNTQGGVGQSGGGRGLSAIAVTLNASKRLAQSRIFRIRLDIVFSLSVW